MTGYRVCLDCDRQIPVDGDAEHQIVKYDNGEDFIIGCEGYFHQVIESKVTPGRYPKDEEFTKFLELLETKFVEMLLVEGWDYIVDNLVHELYTPEDIGPDETTWEWSDALRDTELNATQALCTYFETRLEQITGHEYKITRGLPLHTIEDI